MSETGYMHAYKIACQMTAKARNLTHMLRLIQTEKLREGETMETFTHRYGVMCERAMRYQMQFDTMYAAMKDALPEMYRHVEEDRS